MPSIDFSVPRWLQPPSPEEERRLQLLESEAQQKTGVMLRRYIGMQRARADAQQAMANGVDELTARKNAILNNSHLLFADNPQAFANLLSKDEANQIRDRAQQELNFHRGVMEQRLNLRDEQIAKKEEALQALREKELISKEEALKAKIAIDAEREANRQERFNRGLASKEEMFGKGLDLRERIATQAEEGRNTRAEQSQEGLTKRSNQRAQASLQRILSSDKTLNQLRDELSGLQDSAREFETEEPGWFARRKSAIEADKKKTQQAIAETRQRIRERQNELRSQVTDISGEDVGVPEDTGAAGATGGTATGQAAPSLRPGTIVEQGGKKYRYIGGDTKDPASYAEVVE